MQIEKEDCGEQVCVKISNKLFKDLQRVIPAKMKSALIRCLLEQLVEEIDRNGMSVIGDILDKKFNIRGKL